MNKKGGDYIKVSTDEAVFANFHNLLMQAAPKDYIPYYFRCAANGKEPYTKVGSWLKNPLSFEEACDWLRRGNNVGIAGLNEDPLVLIDIDDENVTDYKTLKKTLTVRSGSRKGVHLYYFEDIIGSIPNIPTENAGEIRANNQYVIAPGSYVAGYKDKVENIGKYTVEVAEPSEKIALYDIPQVFRDQLEVDKKNRKIVEERKAQRKAEVKGEKTDKKSAFFDLTVVDIISSVPNPRERFPSIFHASKTGKNTSISNEGLIICWNHWRALNAQQALCVLSGKLTCSEAGTGMKGRNKGVSLYTDNDEALFAAWKYAKENGFIPKDDPIPTRAMCYIAVENGFCNEKDIKDGWRLPPGAYGEVLNYLKKEGINPGREIKEKKKVEQKEEQETPQIPLKYEENDFGVLTLEKCGNDVVISIKKEGVVAPIIPKEQKPCNFCVRPKMRDYIFSHVKKKLPENEYKLFIEAITPQIENALKPKKEKETKEEKQKKKEAAFNVLDSIESTVENAKTPKYHGTINFNPDLGIFFTVPWAIPPLITKGEKGKIYVHTPIYKPIYFTPREGFARPTDKSKESEIKKYLPTQPKKIIEVISQFSEIIEGVPLYLNQKQQVQLLEAYLTLLKTGENTCKQINEDLVTHLYSKHISYFKYVKDIEHYVVGCWAIGTYLFPMFPVFPYLIFIGEKGTNKSGGLTFLDRVCWNSTSKLSLPNEAPLFRLMHQAKPTQLIDEVHRQLNDPIRGPVFKALLETGHEKGGRVPRCNENDNNKIDFNDVYCPKAMASRESLELEEKAITIIATKVQDKSYAIARKNLDTDPELENIQAGLLNFALTNWEKIYTTYQKIEPRPKLSGRYFMLWAPIIAICKTAYPDKYEEMVEYAEETIMGAQKKSYEIELTVLSWLATRLNDIKNNGSAIFLKDLKDSLNLKWQPTYSALRNLGVIKLDRDTKQGKKYYLRVDRIEKLAAERGITTEDDDTPEKEVCDKCGKDTLTSEYNGMQVCPECKEELMKTEPQKNLFPKNHEKTKRKESEEQEKETKPEETEEENKKELICICGKRFDTIEVLHTHQAKCKEFQQKQDRGAVQ